MRASTILAMSAIFMQDTTAAVPAPPAISGPVDTSPYCTDAAAAIRAERAARKAANFAKRNRLK